MKIGKDIFRGMVDHALRSFPREACGILAGEEGRVRRVYEMANVSEKPEICYFMDPKEQFNVMKEMRRMGLEMLGIYHSHTDSEAYPSERDVSLANYPEALYVIISLKDRSNPGVRVFKIKDERISEGRIELE